MLIPLLLAPQLFAHNPRFDPPEPLGVPEAWNVIHQCTDNVGTLLQTNQLDEIAYQVADCSPAVRVLQAHAGQLQQGDEVKNQLQSLFGIGGNIITAAREPVDPQAKALRAYEAYRDALKSIESHYTPDVLHSEIYICPMHPLDRHLDPSARCSVCNMALVRRRIVASSVYEKPGEPSMKLAAIPDHPLQVGKPAQVRITLKRNSGQPVTRDELLVIHTQPIHLLIVDHTLTDYHHEHPTPTSTPGEYEFTFTPRRPGPYRIWADVVPGWTSLQEYLVADVPSDWRGEAIEDRSTTTRATVDGITYELTWYTNGKPLRVGQAVWGRIQITGPTGSPFANLEPIMGTFAHIVGFNEDYKTVVHIHPDGTDPTKPTDRGGPTLQFRFYPAVAGFTRLYCQVSIGGESKFPSFGVNVLPGQITTTTNAQTPSLTPSPSGRGKG